VRLIPILLALTVALARSSSAAGDAFLGFVRDGVEVKRLELATLRERCGPEPVTVDDPYYRRRKTFLGCPLSEVLALGFGEPVAALRGRDVLLRALDGYVKPVSGDRLLEQGGYLAFGDASRSQGADYRWEPIDRRGVDPGPFYVVWTRPAQRDPHVYPWPYQLASIEIDDVLRRYPHIAPTSAPRDDAAREGFAVFRSVASRAMRSTARGARSGRT
jgi:hypothetical protein